MEKHVYLVRHGETDSNSDGILRGPASMLTEKGIEQAKEAAKRVARIGVDALISSTYVRTMDTAQAIAAETGLKIEESELLVEWRQPSIVINRHRDEPEINQALREIDSGRYIPGYQHSDEETFDEFRGRTLKALTLLERHPEDRLCVVTHGLTLRMIVGEVLFGDAFSAPDFDRLMNHTLTSNTGITYLRFGAHAEFSTHSGGWQLVSWNDSAHLG